MPVSVVGGAEVTSRPHLINMDKMFQKGSKALNRGEREERPDTDRRTDKGLLKLQADLQMP